MEKQENKSIFIDKESPNDNSEPEEVKYIHNTESEDFINQFICDEGSLELSKEKHQSAPLFLGQIKQENISSEQKSENNQRKIKREKSIFHNFQKHLVITLKKIVKIKARQEDGIIGMMGMEMWDIFLKSHLFTKTILHILYGAQQQEDECSFTSAMLNKFGYVDLFNKYSEQMVRKAQCYLRRETIRAIKRVNVKQYLARRRLSKARQFEEYLNEFLQELEAGPIKKRIPKVKKRLLKSFQETAK